LFQIRTINLFTSIIQEINFRDEITGKDGEISLWKTCNLKEGSYYKLYKIEPNCKKKKFKTILKGTKFTYYIPYFPKCNIKKLEENIQFVKFLCFSKRNLQKNEYFDCVGIVSLIFKENFNNLVITKIFLFDCSSALLCIEILRKENIKFLIPKIGQVLVCINLQYSSFDGKNNIHNSFATQNSLLTLKSSLYNPLLVLTSRICELFPEWIYLMNERVSSITKNQKLKIRCIPLYLLKLPLKKPLDEDLIKLQNLKDELKIKWGIFSKFIKRLITPTLFFERQTVESVSKINVCLQKTMYGIVQNQIVMCQLSNFNIKKLSKQFQLEVEKIYKERKNEHILELEKKKEN